MSPTNQGNNNTQTRGRGSIEVEGVEIEEEIKTLIKIDLPSVGGVRAILAWNNPNIEFRTAPFIKNAGRIGGGHTQPIQTPPLLVILIGRKTRKESIEEVQQGSLGIDDPPQKSSIDITQAKTKKVLGERRVKALLKFKQTSKFKKKRNNPIVPTLMLGDG